MDKCTEQERVNFPESTDRKFFQKVNKMMNEYRKADLNL